MPRRKPENRNPYCLIEDQRELGRTLRSRHRWLAVAVVGAAFFGASNPILAQIMTWLSKVLWS